MKNILDTDMVIDHLRGKVPIDPKLLQGGCGISIITQAELIYGAEKSTRPRVNLRLIEDMIDDLEIRILPLDTKIVHVYGKIKAGLERKGERLDEFDLLIASTAIAKRLTLITRNKKHFDRISEVNVA